MVWHNNARVNSHQRWKQTWFRVCFHLWCELTSTMNVMEWQVSWNSCWMLTAGGKKWLKHAENTKYHLKGSKGNRNSCQSQFLLPVLSQTITSNQTVELSLNLNVGQVEVFTPLLHKTRHNRQVENTEMFKIGALSIE